MKKGFLNSIKHALDGIGHSSMGNKLLHILGYTKIEATMYVRKHKKMLLTEAQLVSERGG